MDIDTNELVENTETEMVDEKLSASDVRRRIEDLLEKKRHRIDQNYFDDFEDYDLAVE